TPRAVGRCSILPRLPRLMEPPTAGGGPRLLPPCHESPYHRIVTKVTVWEHRRCQVESISTVQTLAAFRTAGGAGCAGVDRCARTFPAQGNGEERCSRHSSLCFGRGSRLS